MPRIFDRGSSRGSSCGSPSSRSDRGNRGRRRGSVGTFRSAAHSGARSSTASRSTTGFEPRSSPALPRHPARTAPRSSRSHATADAGPGTNRRTTVPLTDASAGSVREDSTESAKDDVFLDEIIMALDLQPNATMGCAVFSTRDGVLALLHDVPMADLSVAEQLLTYVEPTTLLVSVRAPEHLSVFLEKQSTLHDQGNGIPRFILRALPSSEFAAESAMDRILSLQNDGSVTGDVQAIVSVPGDNDPAAGFDMSEAIPLESRNMKLIRYGSLINLDSLVSINCAGAVLSDLHRRRSAGFLPDGQSAETVFRVSCLEMFTLSDYMFISAEDMLSLQLLQSETHPNSQMSGPSPNGAKESLSVYGLFHHLACTPQGRTRLRQIFLRPVSNLDIIAERQRSISLLLSPENTTKIRQVATVLRKIRNIRNVTSQLRKGVDSPSSGRSFDGGVWATLRRFAAESLQLREAITTIANSDEVHVTRKLVEAINPPDLNAVGEMINKVIDFEQSKSRQRSSVKTGVDVELDELKRQYDGMASLLTEVANHVNRQVPEWACQYIRSCIYLPQVGFLVTVEPDPTTGNGKYQGEGTESDGWEKYFSLDGVICYKNRYMRDLDKQYGDMYCEIGDMEVEIIHDLATKILQHEEALIRVSDACGEFDAILALAIGADKYGWIQPQMTTDNTVQIKGGRHPLQELVVPAFVPNDCYLAGGKQQDDESNDQEVEALVLTGPNHSGKSTYIKQTAIIVYLAHIGSFVPAEQATIGLTDRFLTRISTRECVSRNESAFAIDLKHVAQAVQHSTARSLILVDEFGKGTNVDDGAGLLAAFVDHFLSLGPDTPRLILATHFHEVLEGGYLDEHQGLRLGHMRVQTDWGAGQMEDQVTYLFQLTEGHSTSSFGGRCAALNGVPSSIVERAEGISLLLSRNEDLSSVCAKLSANEQQQLETAEAVARKFIQCDFDLEGRTRSHESEAEVKVAIQAELRNLLLSEA